MRLFRGLIGRMGRSGSGRGRLWRTALALGGSGLAAAMLAYLVIHWNGVLAILSASLGALRY